MAVRGLYLKNVLSKVADNERQLERGCTFVFSNIQGKKRKNCRHGNIYMVYETALSDKMYMLKNGHIPKRAKISNMEEVF